MDRKKFIKRLMQAGTGLCCGSLLGRSLQEGSKKASHTGQNWIHDLDNRMIRGSETPAWRKAEKSRTWIKNLMDNMDGLLDEQTKIGVMQACGRSCYLGAFGVADAEKPSQKAVDDYLKLLEANGYELIRKDNSVAFTFNWGRDHQNPQGLIMSDGYCMCPIVEDGPPGLSSTFCYCSTGYVGEIFARQTGRPVAVELIDSLKMGGQDCIFRITIQGV